MNVLKKIDEMIEEGKITEADLNKKTPVPNPCLTSIMKKYKQDKNE